jgi:hypothetical protein
MFNLLRDGGAPIWFVLAFGTWSLVLSGRYAMKKSVSLGFIRGMSVATVFSTLSALCADFGATFAHVSQHLEAGAGDTRVDLAQLIEGLGESMSAGIVGFSLLALTALLVGVGKQRRDADVAA